MNEQLRSPQGWVGGLVLRLPRPWSSTFGLLLVRDAGACLI